MEPISATAFSAVHSPAATGGVKEASKVRQPEDKAQSSSLKAVKDEYVPKERSEPSGRYWMGKNEDRKSVV